MKFILGKKLGMTQVFSKNGEAVPVTRIVAGPCQITQIKEDKKRKSVSAQIGFGEKKEKRFTKPELGHLRDLNQVPNLREFKIDHKDAVERGDIITVDIFAVGDRVSVIGESKGKGFAGVVKRHHFAGGPASHGHKDNLRAPGSIGAGGVQRVFKGMRMAGRMGGAQITVKNLEIIEIHPEINELCIKGAVPGGRNALVEIFGEGELKVKKTVASEHKENSAQTSDPEAAKSDLTA